jgi:hypothetical protein
MGAIIVVSRVNRFRTLSALVVALLLASAHTWPIASAPHRHSLNYNADAQLNAWIVSWIAYALPHDPALLFAGNIFQPDSRALAYSEPLIVPAVVGAPIRWLGGSAVMTFNLLLIAGLAATAFAGWFVIDRWTGSWLAGMLGGSLLAFNTHLLTRLPHLQAAHAWGLPLALYYSDRLLDQCADAKSERRTVLALAAVIAAVAMTSEYWLFFVAVIIAIAAAVGVRDRRAATRIAAATTVGLLLALPALLPYLQLAAEGVRRPIEQAAQFAATPSAYLASMSRLDAPWTRRFFTNDVNLLFPGAVATALAIAGSFAAWTADRITRRRAIALAIIGAVGFVLSFGPSTPIYPLAYRLVVPLQGLRVPARFGFLPLLAVGFLAAFAIGRMKRGTLPGVVLLLAVNLEAWHGPIKTTPFLGVPRIYQTLEHEPAPLLLVETPFWPADAMFGNAEYVLNATEHRFAIANGYSGFTPDGYRRRAQWFWFFPEEWAVTTMPGEGVTHVMVHLEQFGAEAPGVLAKLAGEPRLELIAAEDQHRLYRFTRKARQP